MIVINRCRSSKNMTMLISLCVLTPELLRVVVPACLFSIAMCATVWPEDTIDGGIADAATPRQAMTRLSSHLKDLPTSKERIAPVVTMQSVGFIVNITLIATIASVLGIDDARQTMTSSMFMKVIWKDPTLSWNASDYNDVTKLSVPSDSVWIPDLYFSNSIDKKVLLDDSSTVDVQSDGTVTGRIDLFVETQCDMDMSNYPYDTQTCPLLFSSKTTSFFLFVSFANVYTEKESTVAKSMLYSSQWTIESVSTPQIPVSKGINIYSISLVVKRKAIFYTVCLVLPMVLTSFMNTLVFLVPLQSGEKISFLVTIFVSTSVFVGFFNDGMPRGLDSVPNALKILLYVMGQSFFILLVTLYILHKGHHGSEVQKTPGSTGSSHTSHDLVNETRDRHTPNSQPSLMSKFVNVKVAIVDSTMNHEEDTNPKAYRQSAPRPRCKCFNTTVKCLDWVLFLIIFLVNVIVWLFLFFS